jgi:hypothetical protein
VTRRKTATTAQATATAPTDAAEVSPVNTTRNGSVDGGRVVGGTALPEPGFDADRDWEAFSDEETEPESVDSLRPAIPTPPLAAEPERVGNTERLARQRAAFPSVAAPSPRPAPRRITAELVKAETLLVRLERRRQDSLAHAETVWAGKRVALIKSFPADVLSALVAMHVIELLEVDELEGEEIEEDGD